MVICAEQGANDLHMVQLMPLPPHHLLILKIQSGLPFWCRLIQVVLEKRPLNGCGSPVLQLITRSCFTTLHYRMQVMFCFSRCDFLFFFVCHSNISGTAEQICTKFTGKTCLVPHSEEFEGQGQRSKSGTKNGIFWPFKKRPVCGLCLVKHL